MKKFYEIKKTKLLFKCERTNLLGLSEFIDWLNLLFFFPSNCFRTHRPNCSEFVGLHSIISIKFSHFLTAQCGANWGRNVRLTCCISYKWIWTFHHLHSPNLPSSSRQIGRSISSASCTDLTRWPSKEKEWRQKVPFPSLLSIDRPISGEEKLAKSE